MCKVSSIALHRPSSQHQTVCVCNVLRVISVSLVAIFLRFFMKVCFSDKEEMSGLEPGWCSIPPSEFRTQSAPSTGGATTYWDTFTLVSTRICQPVIRDDMESVCLSKHVQYVCFKQPTGAELVLSKQTMDALQVLLLLGLVHQLHTILEQLPWLSVYKKKSRRCEDVNRNNKKLIIIQWHYIRGLEDFRGFGDKSG